MIKQLFAVITLLASIAAHAQTIRYEAQTRAGVPLVPSIIAGTQSACDAALQARRINGDWHCHRITITSNALPPPVPPPPAPPPPSGYDLTASLAPVPFQVALPAAPRTTRSITVTSEAELRTAFATAGADITVQPRAACYSGNFSTGNDQRIRFPAGANICGPAASSWAGALTVSSQRVHISGPGGVLGGSFIMAATAQDIRLDGGFVVRTKENSTDYNMDQVHLSGTRVLLEGVSIRSRTYSGYSNGARDMVIVNTSMESYDRRQSTLRIVGGQRVVVMDNRMINPSHHNFRVHSAGVGLPSDLVYFARNQLEGGNGIMSNNSAGNPDPQSNRAWYVDNRLYSGMVMVAPPPGNTAAVMTGNQVLTGQVPPAWSRQ